MERTNIERAALLVGATATFSFAQLLETQAADVSAPETSHSYFFPTKTPIDALTNEIFEGSEQGTPEPDIPSASATPNGPTNVRSEPTTTSEKLGSVDVDTHLKIEGYIDSTDGYRWYFSHTNGRNEWYRSDRINLNAGTENLYDLGNIAQIPVADENGEPTDKLLISTNVNLAQTKWVFDALVNELSFPKETFEPTSLVYLQSSKENTLFQQTKDILKPDGGTNEAKSVLVISETDQGVMPIFVGPGQVTDFVMANGISIDQNTRTLRANNAPDGSIILADQSGEKAFVDYTKIGLNLLSGQSTFTDAITILPADLFEGDALTDIGDGKFVSEDGTVYVKQAFSTGIFQIKKTDEKMLNPGIKATPEDQAVLEVAKFNPNPQMDSGDESYKVFYSDNYLHNVLGIQNIETDKNAVLNAKNVAISTGFASLNQRLSQVGKPTMALQDEVIIGQYTNGQNVSLGEGESSEIKGKLQNIVQYVVTDEEYAQILERFQEDSNSPDYMRFYQIGTAVPLNLGIIYFDLAGNLHVVNKPIQEKTYVWSPIADGPATLNMLLLYGLPFGQTKMSAPGRNSADPVYLAFKCDPQIGCPVVPTLKVIH